jgi:hypothetical protein
MTRAALLVAANADCVPGPVLGRPFEPKSLCGGPPHLPPEVLDEAGQVGIGRWNSCEPLGIFERGAEISGISAERHQRLQGIVIGRMPRQVVP